MNKKLVEHYGHYPLGYLMDVGLYLSMAIRELRLVECRKIQGFNSKDIERALAILEAMRESAEDVEKDKTQALQDHWGALSSLVSRECVGKS